MSNSNITSVLIAQFNANSLLGHIDYIRTYISIRFSHIICISETWLHAGIPDELVSIPNYFLIRNDRIGMRGGGVACYVHSSLKANLIAASPSQFSNNPEYMILNIRSPSGDSILFTSMYRRPDGLSLREFLNVLNTHMHAFENVIIAGDLNYNLLRNDHDAKYLRDFASSLSLSIVPSGATFHTNHSDSLLDVLLVDSIEKVLTFEKSDAPFIAGHDILQYQYKFKHSDRQERCIYRRNYAYFNEEEFRSSLLSFSANLNLINFCDCTNENEFTLFAKLLSECILSALDLHAPRVELRVHKPPTPWLTNDLRARMKHRDALYKQAKRANNLLGLAIYKDFRNKLTVDIKRAISEYRWNRLSNINDSSKMWKELDRLGLLKANLSSPLHFFSADSLNIYYASISSASPPCSDLELSVLLAKDYVDGPSFSFDFITPNQIFDCITSFPLCSYSAGSDSIPLFAIRQAFSALTEFITALFNNSIRLSVFLSDWQLSLIRPLSKIPTPLSPSDTRPVAITPEFSKLHERLLHHQIVKYLDDNNILDPRQSGFRKGFSTQSALVRLADDVRKAIDDRKLTILILFDFSKAFDTIPHLRLLEKLKTIGFSSSALKLIHSYLSGRKQVVVDGNSFSSTLNTTCGVPQGSVLGPLLFSIFINDIAVSLRYSKHIIFADDTQIYLHCYPSQLNEAIRCISLDVASIANFASVNGLTLNLAKSKILIIGSSVYTNNIKLDELQPIAVNGISIPYVTEAKNLGVIFSSNLSWKSHINLISQKVNFSLYKLKHNKNALSRDLRTKLVRTLIFPIIDYCCIVYHDLTDELNSKLQVLFNNCIRFIFNLRRDVHITPYRLQLNWLSVKNRRLYFLACSTYRILNSFSAPYLRDDFISHIHIQNRPIRQAAQVRFFSIPLHRTECYRKSFLISSFYLWNSLPTNIRLSPSIESFKIQVYNHFLSIERSNFLN